MTFPRLMPDTFLLEGRGGNANESGGGGGGDGGRRMRTRGLQAPGLDFNQGHPATAIPETHARAQVFLTPHTLASVRFSSLVRGAAAPNSEQLWNFKCLHLSSDTVYIRAILDYQQGRRRAVTSEGKVRRSG